MSSYLTTQIFLPFVLVSTFTLVGNNFYIKKKRMACVSLQSFEMPIESNRIMKAAKRILLIDDDHDHLLTCGIILQDRGYIVLSMVGCEEMEELRVNVKTFLPDLIYMEYDMRHICGSDLTRMLKADPDYKHIPVIYFSDRSDIEALSRETGADAFFKKPFEIDGLLEMTDAHV